MMSDYFDRKEKFASFSAERLFLYYAPGFSEPEVDVISDFFVNAAVIVGLNKITIIRDDELTPGEWRIVLEGERKNEQ